MIDRYARDALACYGRLRRLGTAEARAELELFDAFLGISGQRSTRETSHASRDMRPAFTP